jgi:hypothetical protein
MTIRITNDVWDYDDWSDWGPVKPAPTGAGNVPLYQRCRSRRWTHTWTEEQTRTETHETWNCPSGYEPDGRGMCFWRGDGDPRPERPATGHSKTTGTVVISSQDHVRSGIEHECHILMQYTDLRHAAKKPHGIRPFRDFEAPFGAKLVLKNRFRLERAGVESVRVDGRDLGKTRTIRTDALGVGTALVEIRGRTREGEERFEFMLDVIPPVELTIRDPITAVSGDRTAKLPVRLQNQSQSEQDVVVEVFARPSGWVAGIVESPSQHLDAGKGCTFHVALERTASQARRERPGQLLPMTIRAVPNGDVASAVYATAYVRVAADVATNGRRRKATRAARTAGRAR